MTTEIKYQGEITKDVIDQLMVNIEKILINLELKKSLINKVLFVSVEILQNIYHHSSKDNHDYESFSLSCSDDITIETKNLIDINSVDPLSKKIEQYLSLSLEEIGEEILRRLQHEEMTQKGGASIGLLSILKKTNKNFEYSIINDGEYYILSILVKI